MATGTNERIVERRRKLKVVQQIEYVKKKADVSREFRLVNSTIEMVWENETTVIMPLNRTDREEREIRKPEFSDVDETLLVWLKQEISVNVPVSGSVVIITFCTPQILVLNYCIFF